MYNNKMIYLLFPTKSSAAASSASTTSTTLATINTRSLMLIILLVIAGLLFLYDLHDLHFVVPLNSINVTSTKKEQVGGGGGVLRSNTNTDSNIKNNSNVCQILQGNLPYMPSTDTLWSTHLSDILEASHLDSNGWDPSYHLKDFTAQLLHLISPRLRRSINTLPRDWTSVQRIVQVLETRLEFLNDKDAWLETHDYPPQPLKILVIGGSVTSGKKCSYKAQYYYGVNDIPTWLCTWTNRLELFVAKFTGHDQEQQLVKVINVSRGGSLTDFATKVFFKYGLLPQEISHPHVVINAYATNDIVRLGPKQEYGKLHDMIEESIRTVLSTDRTCSPPLYIHYDDFVGNRPSSILNIMKSSQVFTMLANYYGTGSISYPNMVRDMVYGDTDEILLSPDWLKISKLGPDDKMIQELHPTMGFYIVSMWTMLYYGLDMITNYCTLNQGYSNLLPPQEGLTEYENYNASLMAKTIPWSGSRTTRKSARFPKPYPSSKALPPPLNKELDVRNVTQEWWEADRKRSEYCTEVSVGKACATSWVGLDGLNSASHDRLDSHFKQLGGWTFQNDHGKAGYAPSKPGDTAVLELGKNDKTLPIRNFLFLFMKSYGEKWEGSKVTVTVERKTNSKLVWTQLVEFVAEGWHDKDTSEVYSKDIVLHEPVYPKDDVRVTFMFHGIEGTTFKIMGMALCK